MSSFALLLLPPVFPSTYPLPLEKLLGKGWALEECCGVVYRRESTDGFSCLRNKFLKRKTSAIHGVRPDLVAVAVNNKAPIKEGAGSVLKTI